MRIGKFEIGGFTLFVIILVIGDIVIRIFEAIYSK